MQISSEIGEDGDIGRGCDYLIYNMTAIQERRSKLNVLDFLFVYFNFIN